MLRKPLIVVAGHVDHGKTTLLDTIRATSVAHREPGAITQAIGASIVPIETINKLCGSLLKKTGELKISGLLFIDTPGHAAFTNLRKRGGNLADLAVLVIDINEGIKPQTIEVMEILKKYKTPFIIAANKIDLISGWHPNKCTLLENISTQSSGVKELLDKKLYELVGKIYELGFESERFDKVSDYTKQVSIVPLSAKSGEGVPELLMVLAGLAQKFLEKCLTCDVNVPAKGTILEVKEEPGLGTTLDAIIYDGSIKIGDIIVIGSVNEPIVSKVRALIEPKPLEEMRDKKSKFRPVKEAHAATGVKISAHDIDEAIAGMPIRVATPETLEQIKKEIQKEVEEVLVNADKQGIIIKADTLGGLEALIFLLHGHNMKIIKASVGNITKADIADAQANYESEPLDCTILGFNVELPSDLKSMLGNVRVFTHAVIYQLIDDFLLWRAEEQKRQEAGKLGVLVRPCKIVLLPGYVFRKNNPAVVGIEVLAGVLKTGTPLMKTGKMLSTVKSMQLEKRSINEAEHGKQVAMSIGNVTVGRQINENDVLYSAINEVDFKRLKELKTLLRPDEISVLKEIAIIMRKQNPVWGI